MSDPLPLSGIFVACRGALAGAPAPSAELERALAGILAAARADWSCFDVPEPVFLRYVAEKLPEGEDPLAFLAAVNAPDLYLACACAQGIAPAIECFERAYLAQAPSFLARMEVTPALLDDVQQTLREKLFFAQPGGEAPKITGYSGRGALLLWVRVAVLRTALNLTRTPGQGQAEDDEEVSLEALASESHDSELEYIRASYRSDFAKAVQEAFALLPSKQRNVLRLRFMNNLSEEKIGALLRVHQTTVNRWIVAARAAVFAETKRRLRERLRLSATEFDSLVVVLRSQLDLNVSTLLQDTEA